jgi:uncharacterized protein (DUF427 family)
MELILHRSISTPLRRRLGVRDESLDGIGRSGWNHTNNRLAVEGRMMTAKDERESVWDYPRPPRWELCSRKIEVVFAGREIVKSTRSIRVLETSHPPVYYIPPDDIGGGVLAPSDRSSFCEWKGFARYFHVTVEDRAAQNAAWSYPEPAPDFAAIRDYVAFYAHLMDACFVDGERVESQVGGFYGGWITSHVEGPFKGGSGTMGW